MIMMKHKLGRWIALVSITGMINTAQANEFFAFFIDMKGDGDWTNIENWRDQYTPNTTSNVRFSHGATARITNTVEVGAIQCGVSVSSTVIIDGGKVTATSENSYNSAGSTGHHSSLTIKNKGTFKVNSYFIVGMSNSPNTKRTIYEGTLYIARTFYQNKGYMGNAPLATRTTLYTGGVLNTGLMELNAGVLDIAGGTVIIRQDCRTQVAEWIEKGRIIAMGGVDGWKVKITQDEETGGIRLTAESEEIVLGTAPPAFTDTLNSTVIR